MNFGLVNGGCAVRFSCKNVNKKGCNAVPKEENNFIECNNYEEK